MFETIIINVYKKIISDFNFNNQVRTGINGPYDDSETEARNLSHLITATAILAHKFKDDFYFSQVFAMSEKLYSIKGSDDLYQLRLKPGKDECNGVIGHAWIIEGLIYSYKVTKDSKYLELANSIYKKHRFDVSLGLWNRPTTKKFESAIDYTFNHQLWFACSAAELYIETKDSNILEELEIFFRKLSYNFRTNRDGLISHHILNRCSTKEKVKSQVKLVIDKFFRSLSLPSYEYKEVGYQTFNLYAFARLHRAFPEKEFWKTKKFLKALMYVNSRHHFDILENGNYELDKSLRNIIDKKDRTLNIYGYPYNAQGFEIDFIANEFPKNINQESINKLKENQLKFTYDNNSQKFEKNCIDKEILNYRIYEFIKVME